MAGCNRTGSTDGQSAPLKEAPLVRFAFGKLDAAAITKLQIVDWLAAEKQARNWEPATRNRHQAAIGVVFRVVVDNNKIAFNPAAGIQRLREDNQTTRFLSPA
jgi:site-specific recombinase XerD